MGDKPSIVRNPANDAEFGRVLEDILAYGALDPEEAQQRLRQRYPLAVVRRRELVGERVEVWYVYREGHWVGSD